MTINVIYHLEDDGWWADSPDIPGWTVVGNTFSETRELAADGARFALGDKDDLELRHLVPSAVLPWLKQTAGGPARVDYEPRQVGSARVGAANPGDAPVTDYAAVA